MPPAGMRGCGLPPERVRIGTGTQHVGVTRNHDPSVEVNYEGGAAYDVRLRRDHWTVVRPCRRSTDPSVGGTGSCLSEGVS